MVARISQTRTNRRRPRAFLAALLACLLPVQAMGAADSRPPEQTFGAEVSRGETFSKPLANGLTFRLVPIGYGWRVWIGDSSRPKDNHVAVATPPFRGVNASVIAGWHFRNKDNTGPNAPGPKNVNAPQSIRAFRFVLSAEDHRAADVAVKTLLRPAGRTSEDLTNALRTLGRDHKGGGTLEIADLALGNLVTGKRAWIERMRFSVTIAYPGQ
jgi:hypothetical protein